MKPHPPRRRPSLPGPAALVALVALLVLLVLHVFAPTAEARKEAREPLPADLTLRTLDGRSVTFGELRGKVVVLDFWATWCKPCRDALPHLRRLAARMEDKPFELVSVSVDRDEEAMRTMVEEEEMTWTQVWDPEKHLVRAFGVETYPFYLVVDHEGRPTATMDGWSGSHGMVLDRAVAKEVRSAVKAQRRSARAGGEEAR